MKPVEPIIALAMQQLQISFPFEYAYVVLPDVIGMDAQGFNYVPMVKMETLDSFYLNVEPKYILPIMPCEILAKYVQFTADEGTDIFAKHLKTKECDILLHCIDYHSDQKDITQLPDAQQKLIETVWHRSLQNIARVIYYASDHFVNHYSLATVLGKIAHNKDRIEMGYKSEYVLHRK